MLRNCYSLRARSKCDTVRSQDAHSAWRPIELGIGSACSQRVNTPPKSALTKMRLQSSVQKLLLLGFLLEYSRGLFYICIYLCLLSNLMLRPRVVVLGET